MSRWFRHYAGMCRDEKLVSAAIKSKQPIERVVWVWAAILESAAEIDDDGRYDVDTAEFAYFLRADQGDIDAIMGALEAGGRLAQNCVAKWGRRQFSSDKSRDRVAAYRERKRSEVSDCDSGGTSRNADVTLQKRYCNPPEAETETEAEREITGLSTAPSPRDACLLEARTGIATAYQNSGHLPPDTSRAGSWLASGFTTDEIVSVVSGVLQRGTVPSSLKYFDRPLADLRTAPRAPPRGSAHHGKPRTANDYLSAELRKINDAKSGLNDFAGITIDATAG